MANKYFFIKITGFFLVFFTITYTTKMTYLLILESLLILLLSTFVIARYSKRDLLKIISSVTISNIVPISWIILILDLDRIFISQDISLLLNLKRIITYFIFIIFSYSLVYIIKYLQIKENVKMKLDIERVKLHHLTQREVEIVEELVKGMTYKEIGKKLFISENTVKKHISKIYGKVGVKNKIELIYQITDIQI